MAKTMKALHYAGESSSGRVKNASGNLLSIGYAAKKSDVTARTTKQRGKLVRINPTFAQLKKNCEPPIKPMFLFSICRSHLLSFEPLADHRRFPESRKPDAKQAYRLNANIIEAYERRETLIELYELLGESRASSDIGIK